MKEKDFKQRLARRYKPYKNLIGAYEHELIDAAWKVVQELSKK